MAHIEVTSAGVGDGRVFINGAEVPDLRGVHFQMGVGDVPCVELEVLALPGARLVADGASVHVTLVAYPGYQVRSMPQADGTTLWTVEPAGATS